MIQKYYTLDNQISDAKWLRLWSRRWRPWYFTIQGRRSHTRWWRKSHPKKGRGGWGTYIRNFSESREYYDDEDNLLYRWEPRGKCKGNAFELAGSWFVGETSPSRHSVGWKSHKNRRQWEHRLREQEKHRKNRERKAVHRKGYLTGNEDDSEIGA